MKDFKFLTNFHIRDNDLYVKAKQKTNSHLNRKAIKIHKIARDNKGDILPESRSVWYRCSHQELQTYHAIFQQLK